MPDSSTSKPQVMAEKSSELEKYTRIDLGDVTPHNIKLLKKVNQVVFPIVYHDKFYKDVLEAGELAKLAYYNDVVVGAVCCRIDLTPSEDGQPKRYFTAVWKFQDFSVTQILREINFGECRTSKTAFFAILRALNFVNLLNYSLQIVQKNS